MPQPVSLALSFTIFLMIPNESSAYLDPGTGSILLQGLIAAIATGLATIKFWWHRVASVFKKSEEPVSQDKDDEADS